MSKRNNNCEIGSTDMDTATGIRYSGTRGHDKFKKTKTQIRQGHNIIK